MPSNHESHEPRLTKRERAVLAFERDWRAHDGNKQQMIKVHFGFSPSYYYALLGELIERPEAEAADPLLVRRLRRQRRERTVRPTGLNVQVRRQGPRPASK